MAILTINQTIGAGSAEADTVASKFWDSTTRHEVNGRHARPALRLWTVHSEDSVLVRVESSGAAMHCEIPVQRFEVGVRTLTRHEAQLHQVAGRVVDEDQQCAKLATLREPPAVVAAVNLDQLTVALAPVGAGARSCAAYATATGLRPSSIAAASLHRSGADASPAVPRSPA